MTNSHQTLSGALSDLQGSILSSVEFVHDYLQLHFDGSGTLSAYTPPTVTCQGQTFGLGQSGYRDALCQEIGRRIEQAKSEDQSVSIVFEGGSIISISLCEEEYWGPEALQLSLGQHTWAI